MIEPSGSYEPEPFRVTQLVGSVNTTSFPAFETGAELPVGVGAGAGAAFTVTLAVVFEQPFASVKVKVTVPAETPVTVFPLTVALAGVLLTQVPPVAGVNVIVAPTHTEVAEVVTEGLAFTVTADVVF